MVRVHALAHELQDRGAQALDTGLDHPYPGLGQQLHLIASHLALDLIEQRRAVPPPGEFRQHRAEIAAVQDVIYRLDGRDPVSQRIVYIADDVRRALAPEGKALPVQAAECAVLLGAVPATAAALERQPGRDFTCQAEPFNSLKILLVLKL